MSARDIELDDHACQIVRKALLWGLHAYGEIQRVNDHAERRKALGEPVDGDLVPLDPICRNDGLSIFAEALLFVSANDLAAD